MRSYFIHKALHYKIEKLALKEKLDAQFEMKDVRKLKYYLGIEIAYSKTGCRP